MNYTLSTQTEKIIPDVFVTNDGLAHMQGVGFEYHVKNELAMYWSKRTVTHPKIKIFQNAKDCHGQRLPSFISEGFRQANTLLRGVLVKKHGFQELDEWLLTAGMLETGGDGWHFKGTVKRMESIVLINMICNR